MTRPLHQARTLQTTTATSDGSAIKTFTQGARTIAISSGKGGVGKTQVSANLAVAMGAAGKKVLLLDADLGLASLDLALGLYPVLDLRAVIEGRASVNDVLIQGPPNVWLLPGCPGRYEMANLGPHERDALAAAVDEVSREYDALIIDTGAGLNSNAVHFAAWADDVVLVVTSDPTSLRDAYAMTKVLRRRGGVDRIRVIANQVSDDAEGREIFARLHEVVRRFLSLELDYVGCIPRDEAVRKAVISGEPFLISAPQSPAARATRALAHKVLVGSGGNAC